MPRFGQLNPHDQDPERAQLVQAYMVLHAKQTSVRRRLSNTSISPPGSPTASPPCPSSPIMDATTPSLRQRSSSTNSPSRSSSNRPTRSPFLRRPSIPSIPELPEQEADIDSDEEKLAEIAAHILSTLTDLLNCASVREDARMRSWVQTRLVDAQRSLSSSEYSSPARRRSSCIDPFTVSSVSMSTVAGAERSHARRSSSVLSSAGAVPAYGAGVTHRVGALDDGVRKMSL